MRNTNPPPRRYGKGFARAASLVEARIAKAGESRGFAVSRVLTRWTEIAGSQIAAVAHPVKIAYGRGAKARGATLTLLVSGAHAPMIQMQLEHLRRRINELYGHEAIQRIQITQTAPQGFAEAPAPFAHAPRALAPEKAAKASATVAGVADDGLRTALEQLGRNVLSRPD